MASSRCLVVSVEARKEKVGGGKGATDPTYNEEGRHV